MITCDKNHRPFMVGDVLKVYHFTGARRKRHFMYKQIVGAETLGSRSEDLFFRVSHLNLKDPSERDGSYNIGINKGVLADYEIVQGSSDDFEARVKVHTP